MKFTARNDLVLRGGYAFFPAQVSPNPLGSLWLSRPVTKSFHLFTSFSSNFASCKDWGIKVLLMIEEG